jgi:catechol 2,3-dioxygenase-like lactoylglutathione lyase family enzyme
MTRAPFIDHLTIYVRDYEASKRFYLEALAPFKPKLYEIEGPSCGIGPEGSEDFWIAPGEPGQPLHIAFAAWDRETVDAFHAAALAAGGRDNGGPGIRPQYHAGYYAAFVLDPDGNNVEAVFHDRS